MRDPPYTQTHRHTHRHTQTHTETHTHTHIPSSVFPFFLFFADLGQMCGDDEMESVLLSNRAMCQLLLRNNGSALKDCKLAVRFNPDNIKAFFRAASACMGMARYGECIEWCDKLLGKDPSNKDTVEMRQKAVKLKVRDPAQHASCMPLPFYFFFSTHPPLLLFAP